MEKVKSRLSGEWLAAQKALMSAIGFTEDDLEANGGGYMSKKQRSKLGKIRGRWRFLLGLVILFALLTTIGITAGGIQKFEILTSQIQILAVVWIISFVIALLFLVKKKELDDDLRKGSVEVVEGTVLTAENIIIQIQRGAPQYYIRVQDMSWNVRRLVFDAFKNGDPYAIYYAPNSKKILSAEWVHKREGLD